MKTFRFFGFVLSVVFLYVNFISCSNDDDKIEINENGIVANEKKIVKMIEGNSAEYSFSYDESGNLNTIVYENYSDKRYNYFYTFNWGKNVVAEGKGDFKYVLTTDNLIEEVKTYYDRCEFDYDSFNQLATFKKFSDSELRYLVYSFWEDNKVIKFISEEPENEVMEIFYGEKKSKGFFPIYLFSPLNIDKELNLLIVHPELAGMRQNYLPQKMVVTSGKYVDSTEFLYTFDSDGYIESITIKDINVNERNENPTIYTFLWE